MPVYGYQYACRTDLENLSKMQISYFFLGLKHTKKQQGCSLNDSPVILLP